MKIKKLYGKLRRDQKGVVSYFLVFVLMASILLFLFAVAIPIMLNMNTAFYNLGEDILDGTQYHIDTIEDEEVKGSINDTIADAKAAVVENQTILSSLFQYGWLFVLLIVSFVVFISARRSVEMSRDII